MSRNGRRDYAPSWAGLSTPDITAARGRAMPGTQPVPAAERVTPPRPWGGAWGPSEQDILRWGVSGELREPDPGDPSIIGKDRAGLVDFHFPVPVTVSVMLTAAWLAPAMGAWANLIVFEVDAGIGQGGLNQLHAIVPPAGLSQNPPLPPFFTQQAAISASGVILSVRDIRIGCRMYPGVNQTPGAHWNVSAAIALLGI